MAENIWQLFSPDLETKSVEKTDVSLVNWPPITEKIEVPLINWLPITEKKTDLPLVNWLAVTEKRFDAGISVVIPEMSVMQQKNPVL